MPVIFLGGESSAVAGIADELRAANHDVRVLANSREVIEVSRRFPPDVLILADGLADPDPIGVCAALRAELSVPIIILSKRDDEIDRVVGLELGADEYLVAPVSGREVLARVRSLLRRVRLAEEKASEAKGELLRAGELVVDLRQHLVHVGGRPVALRPREFDLLAYLIRYQGRAHTREELIRAVWKRQAPEGFRTVDIHIRGLREKIEEDPANPTRLQTVRRVGYRLVAVP